MNIACDARALIGPATGVSVWTSKIMAGLAGAGDFRILLAASKRFELPEEFKALPVDRLPVPRIPFPGTLWLHSVLPSLLGEADVFIGSLGVLPRRCPCPGIVMLHDLTPRTHASRHTLANRFCFNAYLEESLDEAVAVVVGSESTRKLALEYFPRIAPKLRTIGYGVDAFYRPPDEDERVAEGARIREKFSGGRPFILYLGTLEARKGLETLLEAWEELRRQDSECPDLLFAGKEGWGLSPLFRRIESSPFKSRVHLPGYVSRNDARALMQHAELFVLPSEAEGFGLPLAEAIACGAPCVASDIPALRESGGTAPEFVAPGDAGVLARAMEDALQPEVTAELRRRSRERRADLGWEHSVEKWADLLGKLQHSI